VSAGGEKGKAENGPSRRVASGAAGGAASGAAAGGRASRGGALSYSSAAGLLSRIHRRYQTVAETLRIGALEIPFTRIADPDRVLDEVAAEEDRREKLGGARIAEPLHLPYWAELWDSAEGMGRFLVEQFDANRGFKFLGESKGAFDCGFSLLDLGCGMGLSGVVAAALGARVTFADLETAPLLFAALNSLPYRRRVRTRQLNWQTDRLAERFNCILGADILYERKQWEFLEPFWREHLAEGGVIILGEPGRQTGDLFTEWIVSRGWKLERFEQPAVRRPKNIRIFALTRV
jgi:predicted nicotinamide N-methyase